MVTRRMRQLSFLISEPSMFFRPTAFQIRSETRNVLVLHMACAVFFFIFYIFRVPEKKTSVKSQKGFTRKRDLNCVYDKQFWSWYIGFKCKIPVYQYHFLYLGVPPTQECRPFFRNLTIHYNCVYHTTVHNIILTLNRLESCIRMHRVHVIIIIIQANIFFPSSSSQIPILLVTRYLRGFRRNARAYYNVGSRSRYRRRRSRNTNRNYFFIKCTALRA